MIPKVDIKKLLEDLDISLWTMKKFFKKDGQINEISYKRLRMEINHMANTLSLILHNIEDEYQKQEFKNKISDAYWRAILKKEVCINGDIQKEN